MIETLPQISLTAKNTPFETVSLVMTYHFSLRLSRQVMVEDKRIIN